MNSFADALDRAAMATFDGLVAHLPRILEALALLLLGLLLARLLRLVARRGATLLDTLVVRTTGQARWGIGRSAPVVGAVVYWVVVLFFLTAATHALGLRTFTDWLARLLDYLPTLAAGLLIIVAGYLISGFVADIVRATASPLSSLQRTALARVAQGATLVVAILVGADQVGLKVTWLAIFAAVVLASVMGGLMVAVSLGARGYVANLLGSHYVGQALRRGQRVRVAGHEGRLVDVTATSIVLETEEGRVLLPARLYHEEAIVVLARNEVA